MKECVLLVYVERHKHMYVARTLWKLGRGKNQKPKLSFEAGAAVKA